MISAFFKRKNDKKTENLEKTENPGAFNRENAPNAKRSVAPNDDDYLVSGNLARGLWRFAFPFMLAYILQALYGAVDLFVVGRYCDAAAVSAVSVGAQTMQALVGVVLGFSVGGVVLIGFNVGAKDGRGTASAVGSTASLFAVAAAILTPLMVFGTNFCVDAMKTPPQAVEFARQYVFVCACGIPFIVGYNVVCAIYRGMGDSKTPVLFVAVACVVNIIGDFALVGGFELGPLGAALATVASQGVAFGYALVHMRRKRFSFEFHRTDFILKRRSVFQIVKVGAPLALQNALVDFSFLLILAIVNTMGLEESAGVGVAERAIGFLMLPAASFAAAVATATAQNLGANRPKRAVSALYLGTLFSLIFGVVFWTSNQIFPETIAGIFTNDPEIARQGGLYLRSFSIDYICVAFIFNFNGYFSGCGKSLIALIHSTISTLGGRIPLSLLFSRGVEATLFHVGFAAPLASIFSVVICAGYFVWLHRTGTKQIKEVENPENAPKIAAE